MRHRRPQGESRRLPRQGLCRRGVHRRGGVVRRDDERAPRPRTSKCFVGSVPRVHSGASPCFRRRVLGRVATVALPRCAVEELVAPRSLRVVAVPRQGMRALSASRHGVRLRSAPWRGVRSCSAASHCIRRCRSGAGIGGGRVPGVVAARRSSCHHWERFRDAEVGRSRGRSVEFGGGRPDPGPRRAVAAAVPRVPPGGWGVCCGAGAPCPRNGPVVTDSTEPEPGLHYAAVVVTVFPPTGFRQDLPDALGTGAGKPPPPMTAAACRYRRPGRARREEGGPV